MGKDKITAVIVDDEQEAINYLCDLLKEHRDISLTGRFTDPVKAIEEIQVSLPDVLFLDVQMPEKSGFDVIREVRSDTYLPHIIFTTAFEKFAIRAIKYAAFEYLVKPINPFELEAAVRKLCDTGYQSNMAHNYAKLFSGLKEPVPLKFNTSNGFVVINPAEIIYLEASRNYCEIHLTGNRMELVSLNMLQVINQLSGNSFFRISRFNTVNLKFLHKVNRIKKECYLLADGLPVVLKISVERVRELEWVFGNQ